MNKYIPQLDWRAYYRKFSEQHGGNPLQWQGWMLFPDGWRYSGTDHRGPEAPPQSEEHARHLKTIYWKLRLASVSKEHRQLSSALLGLEQSQRVYSAPLQQRITMDQPAKNEFGDDIVRKVPGSKDLDLGDLRARIAWLTEDIEECNKMLGELARKPEPSGEEDGKAEATTHHQR